MNYDIKVIDEKSPLFSKKLSGSIIYYDIHHTGSSPDLLLVQDEEGNKYQILSNKIDMKYYEQQENEAERKRLGAGVGDKVIITRPGSGSYSSAFKLDEPHTITYISADTVSFDNGAATMFRPDVKLVV